MCTGRIDPAFILRAFSNGVDGVFIGGCWLGECHYVTEGNHSAASMVYLTRKLLEHIGINPERLRIEWTNASEGIRFAEVVNDFTSKLRELGPLGESEGLDKDEIKFNLEAAKSIIPYLKLVERERLRVRFDTKEEYADFFASEEIDRLFDETIADKLTISQIMLLLRERPLSTGEIADILGLSPSEVSKHLKNSTREGLLRFDENQKRFVPALG
jgi:F420-non-reducing hydrogenase iron-sulfur subunit